MKLIIYNSLGSNYRYWLSVSLLPKSRSGWNKFRLDTLNQSINQQYWRTEAHYTSMFISLGVIAHSTPNIRQAGTQTSWRRSTVVRTLVSAGELSLSCARLLAGWVTTLRSANMANSATHPSGVGKWVVIHVIRYIDYGVKILRGWLGRSMPAGCNCEPNSPLVWALGCHYVRRGTAVIASQLPLPRL